MKRFNTKTISIITLLFMLMNIINFNAIVIKAEEVVLVTGISVSPEKIDDVKQVIEGNTIQLKATVCPENATNKKVIWTSSLPTIASVDESGKVTILGGLDVWGSEVLEIIATTEDGNISAKCYIPLTYAKTTKMTIDESQERTVVEGEYIYEVKVNKEPSKSGDVELCSSDPSVAEITHNGYIKGVKAGTATITAIADFGTSKIKDSFKVTVTPPILSTEIILNNTSKTIAAGEEFTLSAIVKPENATDKTIKWSSSDSSVAEVDYCGNVTGLKEGTATITGKCVNNTNITASCVVTVTPNIPVEGITLDKTTVTLIEGGNTLQLNATITPSNASIKDINWDVDDIGVAWVGYKDGLVTSYNPGTATVTATTKDGKKTATCIVTVEKNKEKPIINVDNLIDGQTVTDSELSFKVTVTDDVDKKIVPIVNLNDQLVTGTDGIYKVTLREGQNTITIEATDSAGNKSDVIYAIIYNPLETKDTESPTINVEDLIDGQNVIEPKLSFKVTVTDNVDKNIGPTVKLNNEVVTGTDGRYNITLKDEENTITVEATDIAGNKSDVTYKIAYKNASKLRGYVTISIEKFTLGQGYNREPVKVPFYEGDNGAMLLARFLGYGNYKNTGDVRSIFYLSRLKDSDVREINIPKYITDKMGKNVQGKKIEGWLGEFDYTNMSGWMYAVNNKFLNVGCSSYEPKDGDVIRWQFTVWGYGLDIGGGWGQAPYITPANKDALTAKIGEINSMPDKNTIIAKLEVKTAYDNAYKVLENMESTQESVEQAFLQLKNAIGNKEEKDTEKPVISVENLTDGQTAASSDLSFKVIVTDNVDKNIVPIVKLNNKVITGTNGTYKVTLKQGENIITIEATDAAGNKSDSQYKIIYKVNPINSYKTQLDKSLNYIFKNLNNPIFGKEWSIINLARGNYSVPNGYYDKYYNSVARKLKDTKGILSDSFYTEYSRTILGLTAAGKDVSNVAGYNQLEKLADYNNVLAQGINGPIFALIALDSKNYEIPKFEVEEQTTRDMLIKYILDKEVNKNKDNAGGWNLFGSEADVDITAMAIQALTPYYKTNNDVKGAVDRGINWLSNNQQKNGGYRAWGSTSSESIAQVIIALTGLGIDPNKDTHFIKEGNSLIDALLSFSVDDGGFMHVITNPKEANDMATDQGTLALVAYDRFINGKNSLYNMNDVEIEKPKDTEKPVISVENLTDGQTVASSDLSFKVIVTDNVDKNIVPIVKLNNEIVKETDGEYKVTLKEGENVITIEATDATGNKCYKQYKVNFINSYKNQLGIKLITPVKEFKVGQDAEVTFRAINNTKNTENVTLIVALFGNNNQFIDYVVVPKVLKSNETLDLSATLKILPNGVKVKCFVWDTLENANPLTEAIEIPVVK